MKRLLLTCLAATVLVPPAAAGTFTVGIADPGIGPIPAAERSQLGLGAERRTVTWSGESSFTGELTWTPGLRHFLAVFSGWPRHVVPTTDEERASYCGFVLSILERYPDVRDVIVWNEPNLAGFWGAGPDAYADLLASCSPRLHAAGARVWAPGMSPSTTRGVADFAGRIAARGKHLIDGWDQHDYSAYSLTEKIAAVRAAFGWKVPLLIGESGGTPGYLMRKAYCAGAIGWLNFKLRDDGDWLPTGLEDADGTHNARWSDFVATLAAIRSGRVGCQAAGSPPSPASTPPPTRSAIYSRAARHVQYVRRKMLSFCVLDETAGWVCPDPHPRRLR